MKRSVLLWMSVVFFILMSQTARAQSNYVPFSFFGMSSSFCNPNTNSNCTGSYAYQAFWPWSSSSDVTTGAAGKDNGAEWGNIESLTAAGQLSWQTVSGSALGGYWQYNSPNWPMLTDYLNQAQVSGVPTMYTFDIVPQWASCYDYGSGHGSYGGPSTLNSATKLCSPALNDGMYNLCPGGNSSGSGYCPGPGYNPDFLDLIGFAQQLVNEFYDSTHNVVKIANYEIWNEPDAANFWQVNGANLPEWGILIEQSYALELAINAVYASLGGGTPPPGPTFIGPGIATNNTTLQTKALCGNRPNCGSSGGTYSGFLNSCPTFTLYNHAQTTECGYQVVTVGTFHLYPTINVLTGTDGPACTNTGSTTDTPIECLGMNTVDAIQNVLADFGVYSSNISGVWMTEGGWASNCALAWMEQSLSSCTYGMGYSVTTQLKEDMRAYVLRYYLLMASTLPTSGSLTVNQVNWFSWAGGLQDPGAYGVLCDNGGTGSGNGNPPPCRDAVFSLPNDIYGGYVLGNLINGVNGDVVGPCQNISGQQTCTDTSGSIWAIPLAVACCFTEVFVWTWDGTPETCFSSGTNSPQCPSGSYGHYLNLEGGSFPITSSGVTLGEEPILLTP